MYKIACMGSYDSIYGFATLGFETFPVAEPSDAKDVLQKLVEEKYAVIYIMKLLAKEIIIAQPKKYFNRFLDITDIFYHFCFWTIF